METFAVRSRKLMQLGMLLFLLGLLVGLAIPGFDNPRMGLSAHLEGVMNGMFLVIVGLAWGHLQLSEKQRSVLYVLLVYGTFANFVATTLSAVWGAGAEMMPIAAEGYAAAAWKESLIKILLYSLAISMVIALSLLVWGLRKIRS